MKKRGAAETAFFSVAARGTDLTCQRYCRKPGDNGRATVAAASGRTANHTLTAGARHNGYRSAAW